MKGLYPIIVAVKLHDRQKLLSIKKSGQNGLPIFPYLKKNIVEKCEQPKPNNPNPHTALCTKIGCAVVHYFFSSPRGFWIRANGVVTCHFIWENFVFLESVNSSN